VPVRCGRHDDAVDGLGVVTLQRVAVGAPADDVSTATPCVLARCSMASSNGIA
jgi:hypothetical protein